MRLRKLIVLGALVAFTGGMMSCSKKADTPPTDSAAAPAAPAPAPAPAPADTAVKPMNPDSIKKAGEVKGVNEGKAEQKKDDMKKK